MSQTTEGSKEQIEQGQKFLSRARVNAWLGCLREAPQYCGKMSVVPKTLLSESWFSADHSIRITYKKDGATNLTLTNPKYIAGLDITGSKKNVFHVSSAPKETPFPVSPILSISTEPEGLLIPIALEIERIKIVDFQSGDGHCIIKFVPTKQSKLWEYLELRFSDATAPLPDKRITKYGSGTYELISYHDYVKIHDFLLPTKFGVIKSFKDSLSFADEATEFTVMAYDPSDKLDESRCYLTYYGLPEPDIGEVADYSKRRFSVKSLIGIGLVGLMIVSLVFYLWKKIHEKN